MKRKDQDTAAKVDGRRARGERSRASVLEHAVEMASIEGLEGLTFGRLAADAGISKGNLTVLFGDKEALQLATLEAAVQRVITFAFVPAMKKPSAYERLRALCDGWFSWVTSRSAGGGCLMYAAAHEYRSRPGPVHELAVEKLAAWRKHLAAQLRAAIVEGDVSPSTDVDRAIITLISYQNMAHLAATTHDRSTFSNVRALSREYLDSLHSPRKRAVKRTARPSA